MPKGYEKIKEALKGYGQDCGKGKRMTAKTDIRLFTKTVKLQVKMVKHCEQILRIESNYLRFLNEELKAMLDKTENHK